MPVPGVAPSRAPNPPVDASPKDQHSDRAGNGFAVLCSRPSWAASPGRAERLRLPGLAWPRCGRRQQQSSPLPAPPSRSQDAPHGQGGTRSLSRCGFAAGSRPPSLPSSPWDGRAPSELRLPVCCPCVCTWGADGRRGMYSGRPPVLCSPKHPKSPLFYPGFYLGAGHLRTGLNAASSLDNWATDRQTVSRVTCGFPFGFFRANEM